MGAVVTRRRSTSPRILLSSVDLRIAAVVPRARPSTRPINKFRRVFGAEGEGGAIAGLITDKLTGDSPPIFGFSRLSTVSIRLEATACAIAAACTGEWSVTDTLMRTVLGCVLACTELDNSLAVTDSPKASIAGCSTAGELTVCTYDWTRA